MGAQCDVCRIERGSLSYACVCSDLDSYKQTPLLAAAQFGHASCLEVLITKGGADVNDRDT